MKDYCKNTKCHDEGRISVPATDLPRLIVLGGGFAGLNVVKRLKEKPVQIAITYPNGHPMVAQVAIIDTNIQLGKVVTKDPVPEEK